MRYLRIVTAFSGAYWAMQEHKWNEIRAFLRFKAAGGVMTEDEIQAAIGAKVDRRESKGICRGRRSRIRHRIPEDQHDGRHLRIRERVDGADHEGHQERNV